MLIPPLFLNAEPTEYGSFQAGIDSELQLQPCWILKPTTRGWASNLHLFSDLSYCNQILNSLLRSGSSLFFPPKFNDACKPTVSKKCPVNVEWKKTEQNESKEHYNHTSVNQ